VQGNTGSGVIDALLDYGVEAVADKPLAQYMDQLDMWGVDVFKIDDFTMHRPLTAITYTLLKVCVYARTHTHIMQSRDLLKTFKLSPQTTITYLMHLEDHYQNNPYHNRIHAADVAQSIHVLLSSQALDVSTRARHIRMAAHYRTYLPNSNCSLLFSLVPYTTSTIRVSPISTW
jgi:hypothetical protein